MADESEKWSQQASLVVVYTFWEGDASVVIPMIGTNTPFFFKNKYKILNNMNRYMCERVFVRMHKYVYVYARVCLQTCLIKNVYKN